MEISYPLDVVANKYSGDRQFRTFETGKPTGATDLALDKINASKYS
jgi:hypothetical protein